MGKFPTLLAWTVLKSGRRRLDDDLVYILDRDHANELGMEQITVEEGYVTDGYSTPRLKGYISILGGAYGAAPKAAVVHDWFCDHPELCGRYLTDKIFYSAMKACGVGLIRRSIIFAGVRAFALVTFIK